VKEPIDIIAAARELWKWRLPMALVLLGVVAGGLWCALTRPIVYRADAMLGAPLPEAYLEVDPESRRAMDFPAIAERALIRHASELSNPEWSLGVLSASLSVEERAALQAVPKARATETNGSNKFAILISAEATNGAIAAKAANALADAYVSANATWQDSEVLDAMAAISRRESQLKAAHREMSKEYAAALHAGLSELDSERIVSALAHVASLDALAQEAYLSAGTVRSQIAEELEAAGVPSARATGFAAELVERPLPEKLETAIASAEFARVTQLLQTPDAAEEPSRAPAALFESADLWSLSETLVHYIGSALGEGALSGLDVEKLASLWQSARRSAIRASLLTEMRDERRQKMAHSAAQSEQSERAAREIDRLERFLGQLAEARSSLSDPASFPRLEVTVHAIPPASPTRPGLPRQIAAVLLLGLMASVGVGLWLEIFSPRSRTQAGNSTPEPTRR